MLYSKQNFLIKSDIENHNLTYELLKTRHIASVAICVSGARYYVTTFPATLADIIGFLRWFWRLQLIFNTESSFPNRRAPSSNATRERKYSITLRIVSQPTHLSILHACDAIHKHSRRVQMKITQGTIGNIVVWCCVFV